MGAAAAMALSPIYLFSGVLRFAMEHPYCGETVYYSYPRGPLPYPTAKIFAGFVMRPDGSRISVTHVVWR